MQSSMGLVEERIIFYKHRDANFYSAWPFVFGRMISSIPQTLLDVLMFGLLMFYFVGFGGREEDASFLLTFLAILLAFAILMGQQLAIFASFANSSTAQAYSACVILVMMLFGGFIIAPDAIPDYFLWAYWWNPFAWAYRSLIVLEFRSVEWKEDDPDAVLRNLGFVTPSGEPFGSEWIGYGFYYMLPYTLLCSVLTALGLSTIRNERGGSAPAPALIKVAVEKVEPVNIPVKPVTLSFRNICYEVAASTKNEKLKLLDNINGIFRPGRMCALMGSSGAGKTTLMVWTSPCLVCCEPPEADHSHLFSTVQHRMSLHFESVLERLLVPFFSTVGRRIESRFVEVVAT